MFLATVSKPRQLLYLRYIQRVSAEELELGRKDIVALLADLAPGFRLVADLSQLDTMDVRCASEIGKIMELCAHKGVELVVRIIPDPDKDIGMNILSLFHYRHQPRMVTCKDLLEAATLLAL
jgi:hypothetical protein